MAIVTVYNRDGTEYGVLDTKQYIFNNNLIGYEPVKLDTKIYPYVKTNGVYYKNDGEEFFSKGRSDNSAGLQSLNNAFVINNSTSLHKIKIGSDEVYTGKDADSTVIKSTTWDSISKVGGYGVSGKALIGSFSRLEPVTDYGFFYHKNFTRQDGKQIEKPLYWTFRSGKPLICYSNLEVVKSNWGSTEWTDVSGRAPQPWYINEKALWTRDEIDRPTDKAQAWWGSSKWLKIYSSKADNDGQGHSYTSNGYYYWDADFPAARPVRIKTYTSTTDHASIISSTGTINGVENLIESGQKIILVKRPLVNLQKLINDANLQRFALLYGTSSDNYYDMPIILAINQFTPYQGIEFWFSREQQSNLGNTWHLCAENWKYGYWNTWNGFNETSEELELSVPLNSLKFYDITSLVANETKIQQLARDISDDYEINPIWRDEVVTNTSQTVTFNFTPPTDDIYYCHGGVKYTFYITNIESLKNNVVSKTPTRHTEYWTHLTDLSHQHLFGVNDGSSVSSSLLFTDVFYWETPLWFSNHFINLGHDIMGVFWSGYGSGSWISPVINDVNSSTTNVDEDKGDDHPDWYCSGGVAGWKGWADQVSKKHIAPIMTSYDENDTSKIDGRYMANVNYLNPFTATHHTYSYYVMNDNMRNGLGVQMGLTTGIAINYSDINAIDSLDGDIPNVSECAVAIIVCDEY